ncbi:MAG TPA: DUF4160 domain-containing protein [Longimicrobium sp.]|nr:DUF4160 domain-containing protein [Longimicrobium sp.]
MLRVEGWAIRIYTDEHAPPHVHARFSGGEVKVLLPPPCEPVTVLKVRRLHHPRRHARRAHRRRQPPAAAGLLERDPWLIPGFPTTN